MIARARKDGRTMSRIKTIAIALLGVAASACAPATNELTAVNNPSIYSVHQPVVQRTDFVLDLRTDATGLPAGEADRLRGWFDSIQLRYGDSVSIDDGGYGAAAKADVIRVVSDYGLLFTENPAPITAGAVPPGSVRVVASRSIATVDGCPNWPTEDNGVSPPQATSANYGCATASNLAAMIANPQDLIEGRDNSGRGSAAVAGRAIRTYRETQPTGRQALQATTTGGPSQ
jgi:pilus assembly protein CpaD